jgi:hypothetical protein
LYPCLVIAVSAATFLTGCGSGSPVDERARFEADGSSPVDVRALVQPEHGRSAARYLRAAIASVRTLTPLLGPYPHASLTIVDPAWNAAPSTGGSEIVLPRTPWWSSPASMTPELATARAIARRYWSEVIDTRAMPDWFVDGAVEYLARRVVAPLFESENLPPGFAMVEPRYFGGFVPRFVRLRLLSESDGGPLEAYRARPHVDVASPPSSDDRRSLIGKTVLTLNTLERWVSRPVFDGAVAGFIRSSRGHQPALNDFARAVSAAASQDLSWFFVQTLAGSAVFDYSVAELTSVATESGGFETTVVVARLGDGLFTGTNAPRVGPYESGRGMTLLVSFADRERAVERWDGRDTRKTFAYRSSSRAVSATIDPDRTLVLDVHMANNSRMIPPHNGTAATRWAARWMIWLENALLTFSALV